MTESRPVDLDIEGLQDPVEVGIGGHGVTRHRRARTRPPVNAPKARTPCSGALPAAVAAGSTDPPAIGCYRAGRASRRTALALESADASVAA